MSPTSVKNSLLLSCSFFVSSASVACSSFFGQAPGIQPPLLFGNSLPSCPFSLAPSRLADKVIDSSISSKLPSPHSRSYAALRSKVIAPTLFSNPLSTCSICFQFLSPPCPSISRAKRQRRTLDRSRCKESKSRFRLPSRRGSSTIPPPNTFTGGGISPARREKACSTPGLGEGGEKGMRSESPSEVREEDMIRMDDCRLTIFLFFSLSASGEEGSECVRW
ncbi:hypothetical protein BT69DRAFT_648207, partial [Atractiella rhizophila]